MYVPCIANLFALRIAAWRTATRKARVMVGLHLNLWQAWETWLNGRKSISTKERQHRTGTTLAPDTTPESHPPQ